MLLDWEVFILLIKFKVIIIINFLVTEDIANVALFLGSKDASYITGECITAAGMPIPRL